MIGDLVGVIDLKEGLAVHAVKGQRQHYRPVNIGVAGRVGDATDGPHAGAPKALADHYWSLGLRRLYVADLDGMVHGQVQTATLEHLLSDANRWVEVLLDLGCQASATRGLRRIAAYLEQSGASHRLILATESAERIERLQRFAESIPVDRLLIGLDYREGVFIAASGDEELWLAAARRLGLAGAVVLDVASVGTGDSRHAANHCRRIRSLDARLKLYSGGGIRSADDVKALRACGCDRFLVATALHGL